jgi:hypothetical protein
MKFSQRKGFTPIRLDVQRDGIDEGLRNRLWSALCVSVFDLADTTFRYEYNESVEAISTQLWMHYFNKPIDEKPRYNLVGMKEGVREWFMRAQWYEVYDFVEAVAGLLKEAHQQKFLDLVNSFLAQDQAAYRFVGARLADITNQEEIDAIEGAMADSHPLVGVRTHLDSAIRLLTDRKSPDYRNSAKESISAVESMCQTLTGDTSATLGTALKKLEDSGIDLHPAIKQAWLKLYGYTSDAGGIRHALSDVSSITRSDAKYMLVSCSAFISFLTEQAAATGIKLKST